MKIVASPFVLALASLAACSQAPDEERARAVRDAARMMEEQAALAAAADREAAVDETPDAGASPGATSAPST